MELYTTSEAKQSNPDYDLLQNQTVISAVPALTSDFFSDNTQALPGWSLTASNLYAIDDFFAAYFGRTATIENKQSIIGYTLLRHVAGAGAQAVAAYGMQASSGDNLPGAISAGTDFTHPADCRIIFTVDTVPSASVMGVWFRIQDASHFWFIHIESTGNIILYEFDGSPTGRASAAGAVGNGDTLEIRCLGESITIHVNDVQVIEYTSAANFKTATAGYFEQPGTGGAASDLSTVPAAGSGGVNGQGAWQLVDGFEATSSFGQEYANDQFQNEIGSDSTQSAALNLFYDAGVGQRITAFSMNVEWHCTRNRETFGIDVRYRYAVDGDIDLDTYANSTYSNEVSIADYGGANPISQSGSDTIGQTGLSTRYLLVFVASAQGAQGTAHMYATSITLTFDDGSVKVLYSADNGDTISETTFWAAIDGSSFAVDDVDDFGLGVHVAASESSLAYSTAYDGAFTALDLTPIGSNVITCVRIPYRKLLTQALNNDATALQFIYALDNGDLWGVTFDTTDGSIISENEMTIEIASTTYYVVGPEALETAGTNTQVILAFVKPVGGGDTILAGSATGGTLGAWSNLQTLDGDFVRWVFGSSKQAALSGDGGAWLTQNRGSTVQVQTGSLSGTPLNGFICFPQA